MATVDRTRMPPHCCRLLQIHTTRLTDSEASRYRAKFEEWITCDKTYCPSPTCSAFVPERHTTPLAPGVTLLPSIVFELRKKLQEIDCSRFCRGDAESDAETTQMVGHVPASMNLAIIADKSAQCTSIDDLTRDVLLIVRNAYAQYEPSHTVVKTADELLTFYLGELSSAKDQLIGNAGNTKGSKIFACPTCHVAIFTECKQLEHASPTTEPKMASGQTSNIEPLVNLDAGGHHRWLDSALNFCGEPDQEMGSRQIWSCRHRFIAFRISSDARNYGDLDRMECNRCFKGVVPLIAAPTRSRSFVNADGKSESRAQTECAYALAEPGSTPAAVDESNRKEDAWECSRCSLVVCTSCLDRFPNRLEEEDY